MQQTFYCPTCRAPVPYGAQVCQYCGNQLHWQQQTPPIQQQPPYYQQQQSGFNSQQLKKKRSNTWLIVLGSIVAFIVLIGVIAGVSGGKSSTTLPTDTKPPSATPSTPIPQAPILHTISSQEIRSNPAYWNLAWQGKYGEMEKKVREINQTYSKTHTYIAGQTDCNDMAIDIWNILQTGGITSIIVVGNLELDNYTFAQCNHAWLIIYEKRDNSEPAAFALEATNGQIYASSDTKKNYWSGFRYTKPSDLRTDLKEHW